MDDYAKIAEAIRYIDRNKDRQPSLEEVSAHLSLSMYHFQRLFTRWAGISPKRFLQYLTAEHAKALLESSSVMNAAYDAGLSAPSRLHDLLVSVDAVTPGQYKAKGGGLVIEYGRVASSFGECFIAQTEKGVCHLSFTCEGANDEAILAGRWSNSVLKEDSIKIAETAEKIFGSDKVPVPVHMKGTNFQIKVWTALLRLPENEFITYQKLAEKIGSPSSARAVGNAAGQNCIGYLIPCHRVLRSTGEISGYRWGAERKKAIIAYESARADATSQA
jgi:AraC family transcriptional regulator of adaptative response/methylated-DNA-[protein]-cysteine methyltransferase